MADKPESDAKPKGALGWWMSTPLYARIAGAVVLGVVVGLALGAHAAPLGIPSRLVLRLLGALAAPLVLTAVVNAFMHVEFPEGAGWKLARLLLQNTLVAILIGLLVANALRPGTWREPIEKRENEEKGKNGGMVEQFLENVPKSLLGPLGDDGKTLSVIFLAVAFGVTFRRLKNEPVRTLSDFVELAMRSFLTILHWIVELVPLAVFGVVAATIGKEGFGAFGALGGFVVVVLLALALQTTYYLAFIRLASWVHPWRVLVGMRDALTMAFSTASSTATMPVTYACLREKVGLRERSANLGALVGANFNNDGTALYEAMAVLFIAQMTGKDFTFSQQILVVLASIVASVGAAGIPEAGMVTMTFVFDSVGVDKEYVPLLLTVDWFLDRCRTTMNVLGDVTTSCVLDGQEPEPRHEEPAARELNELLDQPPTTAAGGQGEARSPDGV